MFYASLILIIITAAYDIVVKIADFKKDESNTLSEKIKKGANVFFPIILMGLGLFIFISESFEQESKLKEAKEDIVSLTKKIDTLGNSVKDSVIVLKDSLIKNIRNASTENIVATNTALAKYNLLYVDSLNRVIGTIDGKRILPNLTIDATDQYGTPPIFFDSINGIESIKVRFFSEYNVSHNVYIRAYIFGLNRKLPNPSILQNLLPYFRFFDSQRLIYKDQLSGDYRRTYTFDIELKNNMIDDDLFILISGRYYNHENYNGKREFNFAFFFNQKIKKPHTILSISEMNIFKNHFKIPNL